MDAERKRQILNAEARAELISTLVEKGFYVYRPDEVEGWHRARGGAPDALATARISKPGAPGGTATDNLGRSDIAPSSRP